VRAATICVEEFATEVCWPVAKLAAPTDGVDEETVTELPLLIPVPDETTADAPDAAVDLAHTCDVVSKRIGASPQCATMPLAELDGWLSAI
jgi:hypothetical protein